MTNCATAPPAVQPIHVGYEPLPQPDSKATTLGPVAGSRSLPSSSVSSGPYPSSASRHGYGAALASRKAAVPLSTP
jgi:hypothetical protein